MAEAVPVSKTGGLLAGSEGVPLGFFGGCAGLRENRQRQRQGRYIGRFGCVYARAFGREEAASRRAFDAGLKPRSTSEATAKGDDNDNDNDNTMAKDEGIR